MTISQASLNFLTWSKSRATPIVSRMRQTDRYRATTLFDKIWDSRIVMTTAQGESLLYVDKHILHEGATPLAFAALRVSGRGLRRPDAMIGVIDHTIPT